MPQQYKIDKVAEIESRIAENAGLFVVNYNGLTVKQAQELRHQLRECGAEMKVYKNNLVKIALKNQEQPELDEILGELAHMASEATFDQWRVLPGKDEGSQNVTVGTLGKGVWSVAGSQPI